MNTLFIYANKHSNDSRCYHNDHDRSQPSSQLTHSQHKHRKKLNVSKQYTGKDFRLIEHKETL